MTADAPLAATRAPPRRFNVPARPSDEQGDDEVAAAKRRSHLHLAAKKGALVMHSMYSAEETTLAGRLAFRAKFDAVVDPTGVLDPEERGRRSEAAYRAHFIDMALRSARARRRGAQK